MTFRGTLLAFFAVLACPVLGRAQPFFAPGVSSFTPEISVLNTGAVTDVQATVSPDRRYVTLGMRPQNSQLLNLYEYRFQGPPLGTGFVGGVQFADTAPATGTFGAVNPAVALAPGKGEMILRQRGMTRISGP